MVVRAPEGPLDQRTQRTIAGAKILCCRSLFPGHPETKFILDNYLPVGKTTATHATEIFPKLNDVEGEGALQSLSQSILQGKDVGSSAKAAAGRLKSVLED